MKRFLAGFFLFFALFPKAVFAGNDLTITCNSSDICQKSTNDPLFDEHNIAPGFYRSQTLKVVNQRSDICDLLFSPKINNPPGKTLAKKIMISITDGVIVWYAGTLDALDDSPYRSLGSVNPGGEINYLWTSSFDQDAGNEYQNKNTDFDINFNITCLDSPTPTPVINPESGIYLTEIMPNPASGNEWVEIYNDNNFSVSLVNWDIGRSSSGTRSMGTINLSAKSLAVFETTSGFFSNASGLGRLIRPVDIEVSSSSLWTSTSTDQSWSRQTDGTWCHAVPSYGTANNFCSGAPTPTSSPGIGGDGGGTPAGPSVCSDSPPQNAPTLISAVTGPNSVRLTWSASSGPLSYYLIAYGTSPGVYQYGNPNVGGPGTTSYLVGSLSAGQTYYFVVRAGNGCAPGPFSNELSSSPPGSIFTGVIPAGFQPGVLGVQETLPTAPAGPSGSIAGEQLVSCTGKWLPLLWLLVLLFNLIFFRRRLSFKKVTLGLILGLTAFFIDRYFLKKYCCSLRLLCHYFWVGNIISLVLPFLIALKKR